MIAGPGRVAYGVSGRVCDSDGKQSQSSGLVRPANDMVERKVFKSATQ